jgi:hypothetical protein
MDVIYSQARNAVRNEQIIVSAFLAHIKYLSYIPTQKPTPRGQSAMKPNTKIDYHVYIHEFFISPKKARRMALQVFVPWQQIVKWERDIRNEYNDSFVPEFDVNLFNAQPMW